MSRKNTGIDGRGVASSMQVLLDPLGCRTLARGRGRFLPADSCWRCSKFQSAAMKAASA